MSATHVCFTDSCSDLVGKKRTYRAIKARVLEAGMFAVWDATQDAKSARLFSRLHRDPEIEIYELPYPWIGVRSVREAAAEWCGILASDRASPAWTIHLDPSEPWMPSALLAFKTWTKVRWRNLTRAEQWAEAEAMIRTGR